MTLAEVLTRLQTQLRITPLVTDMQLVTTLQQSIQKFCAEAQVLEKWIIIPVKERVTQYWLPANHQVTTLVYYDEKRLGMCTAYDAQLVSPDVPAYYFEDEWSDDASTYLSTSFLTQYTLLSDMILQWLAREQSNEGRKTITLVGAPLADGDYGLMGSPPVGIVYGGTYDPTVVWGSGVGIPVAALSSVGNLIVFYKYRDDVPTDPTVSVTWDDSVTVGYIAGALSLALATETDEYDRYRSWLYGQIASAMATSMRGLAINRGLR